MTSANTGMKAILSAILVAIVALGAGILAAPKAQAAVLVDSDTVRVQSGDTLSGIARDFLGNASRWTELAELNDLEDPNLIVPGQLINLGEEVDDDNGNNNGNNGGVVVDDDDDNVGELIIIDRTDDVDTSDDGDFDELFQWLLLDELILSDDQECPQVETEPTCPSSSNELINLFILAELFNDDGGNLFNGDNDDNGDFDELFQWLILDEVLNRDEMKSTTNTNPQQNM